MAQTQVLFHEIGFVHSHRIVLAFDLAFIAEFAAPFGDAGFRGIKPGGDALHGAPLPDGDGQFLLKLWFLLLWHNDALFSFVILIISY